MPARWRGAAGGQVNINYPDWDTFAPFGGYNQVGQRPRICRLSIQDFLELKSVIRYGVSLTAARGPVIGFPSINAVNEGISMKLSRAMSSKADRRGEEGQDHRHVRIQLASGACRHVLDHQRGRG